MMYKDINIFACKFFTISAEGKLQFYTGKHKGKTIDDFLTIGDVHAGIGSCFWIIKQNKMPLVSVYLASDFLKDLCAKASKLERVFRPMIEEQQKILNKQTEEAIKTPGLRYGSK